MTASLRVLYENNTTHGNEGSEAVYASTAPAALNVEFLFDGTGVIPSTAGSLENVQKAGTTANPLDGNDKFDVMDQLKAFLKVVYDSNGDIHRPRKVQLVYGKLAFDGVLESLDIEYKLFKPDGTPLRAVAKASFKETISDLLRENKEKNSSPDLTHVRTVHAGDTRPLLTHSIYSNSSYYLEVARTNKLYSFRRLTEGSEIAFPPVDKSEK